MNEERLVASALEIENGIYDLVNFADASHWIHGREKSIHIHACKVIGIVSGASAFTRIPLSTCSIARDRFTALSPPFVMVVNAAGRDFNGCSDKRLDVMLTICPLSRRSISAIAFFEM